MFITSRNFSPLRESISLAEAERNNPEVILIGCRKHPEMIRHQSKYHCTTCGKRGADVYAGLQAQDTLVRAAARCRRAGVLRTANAGRCICTSVVSALLSRRSMPNDDPNANQHDTNADQDYPEIRELKARRNEHGRKVL
jgi:hypothetical protein